MTLAKAAHVGGLLAAPGHLAGRAAGGAYHRHSCFPDCRDCRQESRMARRWPPHLVEAIEQTMKEVDAEKDADA
jgi:hypothetical protein